MKHIVIDREYGSGGLEVAKILSQKLGMDYYDGNLLEVAGERYGIDLGMMKDYDEKGTGSVLHDIALFANVLNGEDAHTKRFRVYEAESRLIKQLAMERGCIFLGRCADEILKNMADFVHVFVYASNFQDKIDRAVAVDGIAPGKASAYIRKKDMQRKNYRKFFCNREWALMRDYDLCINTSAVGYEKAAEAVMAIL